MERREEVSYVHSCGALFEEWVVSQWAQVEESRLNYFRVSEQRRRMDTVANVRAAAVANVSLAQVGRRVMLPSSFLGGPRYMNQLCAASCQNSPRHPLTKAFRVPVSNHFIARGSLLEAGRTTTA